MAANQILLAAGAGIAGAILFATLVTGSVGAVVLAYFAPLPLFAAGLALGVSAAAIAAAAGTLAMLAIGGLILAIMFALLGALPAVIITRQALLNRPGRGGGVEWYPPGPLLITLAGAAVALFTVLLVVASGQPGGLEGFAREAIAHAFRGVAPAEDAPIPMAEVAAAVARYLPGIVAISWLFMSVLNGVLAQALLTRLGYNRRPSPRMSDIELPSWLPIGAAIAAIGAFMPGLAGFVGGNLLLISLAVFFFAGLAVIHAMAGTWRSRAFWLLLIYTFTVVFTWPAVLIALLGVVETWAGLRHRFAARPPHS